jgi:hypothetical protein
VHTKSALFIYYKSVTNRHNLRNLPAECDQNIKIVVKAQLPQSSNAFVQVGILINHSPFI